MKARTNVDLPIQQFSIYLIAATFGVLILFSGTTGLIDPISSQLDYFFQEFERWIANSTAFH